MCGEKLIAKLQYLLTHLIIQNNYCKVKLHFTNNSVIQHLTIKTEPDKLKSTKYVMLIYGNFSIQITFTHSTPKANLSS